MPFDQQKISFESWLSFVGANSFLLEPVQVSSLAVGSSEKGCILIIAPHPDDECLMGFWALREAERTGSKVIVVPYSLGSNIARQQERREELLAACHVLGFEVDWQLVESNDEPKASLIQIFQKYSKKPLAVIFPHQNDGHPTHKAASLCAADAIRDCNIKGITCVETEFWFPMQDPNVLFQPRIDEIKYIFSALERHEGEVSRNPYHMSLPSWLRDSARRGQEIVGGFGSGAGSSHPFGVLLKVYQN